MEKRNKIICLVLAILLIVFIGINYYKNNYSYPITIEPEPDPEPIGKSKYDFVDNQVMISVYKGTTYSEIEEFFNKQTDIINKKPLGSNGYLLTLNHSFGNRRELTTYCSEIVANNKGVIEYCEANNIIKLDDCSKGPC